MFEEGLINPALDFSRSFSIFGNSYTVDQMSVGLSLNFDPYCSKLLKMQSVLIILEKNQIFCRGSMFASGADQQFVITIMSIPGHSATFPKPEIIVFNF